MISIYLLLDLDISSIYSLFNYKRSFSIYLIAS